MTGLQTADSNTMFFILQELKELLSDVLLGWNQPVEQTHSISLPLTPDVQMYKRTPDRTGQCVQLVTHRYANRVIGVLAKGKGLLKEKLFDHDAT